MPKGLLLLIIFLFTFFISPVFINKPVFAANCSDIAQVNIPSKIDEDTPFVIEFSGISPGWYKLVIPPSFEGAYEASGGSVKFTVNNTNNKLARGRHSAVLERADTRGGKYNAVCDLNYIVGYEHDQCTLAFKPSDPTDKEQIGIRVINSPSGTYFIGFRDANNLSGFYTAIGSINIGKDGQGTAILEPFKSASSGKLAIVSGYTVGDQIIETTLGGKSSFCLKPITVKQGGTVPPRPAEPPSLEATIKSGPSVTNKCDDKDPTAPKCSSSGGEACSEGIATGGVGIKTAIGCVPTEPRALVNGILRVTAGGIGAVALLLMIMGAITMITADGNPDTIQRGKDQFTAAFLGLLFIIFSVLLLQVIGVDILGLPGFGKV